jgi:phosphate transport system substrate-binding protein
MAGGCLSNRSIVLQQEGGVVLPNVSRNVLLSVVAVTAAFGLAGCGKRREKVTLAGSTAFQPFAEKLAEQYMSTRAEADITVQGGGSAVGVQSALSGAAQIGMADLVTLPPEAKDLVAVAVARDGIALVINPKNPVTDLSTDRIRDVFNGKITSWKDLGGEDHAITVVSREAGSGTRSSFEDIVTGIRLTPNAIVQDSNGTIRETVANDAYAIGYLSHGLLNDRIKSVTVDGNPCTTDVIMAGKYALVRPIYLLTKGAPAGAAKGFIDYVLSPEGQGLIRQDGLIPAK